jgi:hypothetical protein
MVTNFAHQYWNGLCSFCSGFFTGNKLHMTEFCRRILEKFVMAARLGKGHADEQLFSLVFFDNPSLFDVYLGDYSEMIVNYGWVRDRHQEPFRLLLSELRQCEVDSDIKRTLLPEVCDRWILSAAYRLFDPDPSQLAAALSWRKYTSS